MAIMLSALSPPLRLFSRVLMRFEPLPGVSQFIFAATAALLDSESAAAGAALEVVGGLPNAALSGLLAAINRPGVWERRRFSFTERVARHCMDGVKRVVRGEAWHRMTPSAIRRSSIALGINQSCIRRSGLDSMVHCVCGCGLRCTQL